MKRLQRARRKPGLDLTYIGPLVVPTSARQTPVLKVSRYSQIVPLLGIIRPMLTEPKQIGAGSGGSR